MRLDDASVHMKLHSWLHMKKILDKYGIKPIYGIIPNNMDPELLQYEKVDNFWELVKSWQNEGWIPAMHGCTHVFETKESGINPINQKSEFAGLPLERQQEKIRIGYKILKNHGIETKIFFAPAHTFDDYTLQALCKETPIRVISDMIANDIYYNKQFYFVPQQCGSVRRLPFHIVTFCYHPNTMRDEDFKKLEKFLEKYHENFDTYSEKMLIKRENNFYDKILRSIYFTIRRFGRIRRI